MFRSSFHWSEQPNPLLISLLVGDNKLLLFISPLMNAVKMGWGNVYEFWYVVGSLITATNSKHTLLCFTQICRLQCIYSISEGKTQPSIRRHRQCLRDRCEVLCCRGRDSDGLRCGLFLLILPRGWPPATHWRATTSSPHWCSMTICTCAWQCVWLIGVAAGDIMVF